MNQIEPKILIIINPGCHQGKGWKRWMSVRDDVVRLLNYPATEFVIEPGVEIMSTISRLSENGRRNFIISAGGDGSMHYLVNALLKSGSPGANDISLGAIGLGSSNDFLKPFTKTLNRIPVQIDVSRPAKKYDTGLAKYYDENNTYIHQYFIVNASFGVTALANWKFNNPGNILRFLKSNSTGAAILYTAIATILHNKNINCHIKFNGRAMDVAMSNVNILKIPFVSGSFRYDQKISPNDGKLGLHICRDMNTMNLLKILSQLTKGEFNLGEKTITEIVTEFYLSSKKPVIFECDGETSRANDVRISVVPEAINVLSA